MDSIARDAGQEGAAEMTADARHELPAGDPLPDFLPSVSEMRRAGGSEIGYEAALPFLAQQDLPLAPLLDGWFLA